MATENPLQNLPDMSDAEDLVTLSTDPAKLVAKKTVAAYTHAALAAAVAVPLLASGGVQPTISNVQARKPDVESTAASQGQSQPTAEPQRSVMVAAASGNALSLEVSDTVHINDDEIIMDVEMTDETPS